MDLEKTIKELNQARHQTADKLRDATIHQLQQDRHTSLEILVELNAGSEKTNPGLNNAVRFIETELEAINRELRRKNGNASSEAEAAQRAFNNGNGEYETTNAVLRPDQSVRQFMREHGLIDQPEYEELGFGSFLRAMVVGPKNALERRALSEGTDSAGGYTVPVATLAEFIDRLRAAQVCVKAGARTVPLDTNKTVIARLASDPVAGWRNEGASVAESDPTFDSASHYRRDPLPCKSKSVASYSTTV